MRSLFLIYIFSLSNLFAQNYAYHDSLQQFQQKERKFYLSKLSPFNKAEKKLFRKSSYYPIDTNYCIWADFSIIPNPDSIIFPTSSQRMVTYLKYAQIRFRLQNQWHVLFVYKSPNAQDEDALFLPFQDAGNGKNTYGGGRYLDLNMPADNSKIRVDFNRAYHPYCAYSNRFSCPIVPPENRLPVEICAGSKLK